MKNRPLNTAVKWLAGAFAVGVAASVGYVGTTWFRYGRPSMPAPDEADPLLDRFMPKYDIAERHQIHVAAPADTTFAAACETDLMQSGVARAIFKAREVILRSEADDATHPRGVLAFATSIGWGVLTLVPGREVVVGAVTKPWEANVVFQALRPEEFAAFDRPGYVKIAWTLRADPTGPADSIFRTETRAVATDATAHTKFRRYWSLLSPGIITIRWVALKPVKLEAERRARAYAHQLAFHVPGPQPPL